MKRSERGESSAWNVYDPRDRERVKFARFVEMTKLLSIYNTRILYRV